MKKLSRISAFWAVLLSFALASMIEQDAPMSVTPFVIAFAVFSAVAIFGIKYFEQGEKEHDITKQTYH